MDVVTFIDETKLPSKKLEDENKLLLEVEKLKANISKELKIKYKDAWIKSLTNNDGIYYNFLVLVQQTAIEKLKSQ